MSAITILEFNHDRCPRDEAGALRLGLAIQAYMRTMDSDNLPPGVTFRHYRHNSDPDPMADLVPQVVHRP